MVAPTRRCVARVGHGDAGDTLVEVLVAVSIIGIAVTGLLGGLLTSTATSATHRNLANLDSIVKTLAESARNSIETSVSNGGSAPQFVSCPADASAYKVVGSANPRTGPTGSVVTVYGTGYTAATEALLTSTTTGTTYPIQGSSYTFVGPSTGAFAQFTIPNTVPAGTYSVTPFDTTSPVSTSLSAASYFTVTSTGSASTAAPYNQYSLVATLQDWSSGTSSWVPAAGGTCSNLQRLSFQLLDAQSGSLASDTLTAVLANFSPSSLTSTVTSLAATTTTPVVGQQVTYTATVSTVSGSGSIPSSDTVTFEDGSAAITCASGSTAFNGSTATCKLTYSAASSTTHIVTAVFGGDSTHATSTSPAVGATVGQASTTTALAASPSTSVVSTQTVTYTATVSVTSPGGGSPSSGDNVVFKDGSGTITCGAGSASFNGSTATCTVTYSTTTGSPHSITAVFSGDTNYSTSTSSAVSETVSKAGTTTGLAASTTTPVVGQQVTYTATVTVSSPATGTPSTSDTVTFKDGAATITCGAGSLSFNGTSATCTATYPGTGSHSITAVFGGDATYGTSTSSPAVSVTVGKASTQTSLTSSQNPATHPAVVTYTATVTVSPPGSGSLSTNDTVAFKDNGTTILGCGSKAVNASGVATCTATYPSAGPQHPITAIVTFVAGDTAKYNLPSTASLTETIN